MVVYFVVGLLVVFRFWFTVQFCVLVWFGVVGLLLGGFTVYGTWLVLFSDLGCFGLFRFVARV